MPRSKGIAGLLGFRQVNLGGSGYTTSHPLLDPIMDRLAEMADNHDARVWVKSQQKAARKLQKRKAAEKARRGR